MNAKVINFLDFKKTAENRALSVEQIAERCSDEISWNWERFARNNRLNDYFVQNTPWTDNTINYLSDLNALSLLENKPTNASFSLL